ARDNTPVVNAGRWVGTLHVNNSGRSVQLGAPVTSGDMGTLFSFTATPAGGTIRELHLIHNGRVVASSSTSPANLQVYGRNLGAGAARVQAEAVFTDGSAVRSDPVNLAIAYTIGTLSGQAPVAYSFTKKVARGGPFVVELPARFDDGLVNAVYSIVTPPTQGTT